MKWVFKITAVLLLVFVLSAAGGLFYLSRGLEQGAEMVIHKVDPASLGDGVYRGRYSAGRWTNEVIVTIEGHRITGIEVVKDVTFVKPEVREQLIDAVIERQNTDVDTVSGATVSSKAYLKAIESAFE